VAKRTITVLTDDLTGQELEPGTGQTVSFALDGQSYELDLAKDSAEELREAFKRYTQAARRMTGRQAAEKPQGRRSRQDTSAIREWAKANGHEVNERGRIASSVVQAYEAAN
jgi:hypothetical protein